ncbi:Tm-1-like ATP-binding domain-containing protein [Parapedobacter sp. 2B3]|uniref:Tm-1-like ATP-binding domain-containing protein n=1 Tax=Parapedobacter sp. 2B3 TaxID=3342381 RepID=UPI0035B5A064
MSKKLVVIGTFDTKAIEYKFVIDLLKDTGDYQVTTINTGIMGSTDLFKVDIETEELAAAGGTDLLALRRADDRGKAIAAVSEGAKVVIKDLYEKEKFDGIMGMGGTAGTHIVTAGMRELPVGIPKICISTVASGNVEPYLGISDIILIPSLTDIAGINPLSSIFLTNAVAAMTGMLQTARQIKKMKPVAAATMFGNTTLCIDRCRAMLEAKGFDVLVFHATGTGGRMMEKLVNDGFIDAVLDLTTTEWADTLCGGVFGAGTSRLEGPGNAGIPHLIAPGCIDMCNFGSPDTIKPRYKDRLFYQWNPNVTLMRTTPEENHKLGEIFAQKANASKGKTAFIIPKKGYSLLDAMGQEDEPHAFWDPHADRSFVESLKRNLNNNIDVIEVEANINDPVFAEKAVEKFLDMVGQQ